MNYFSIVPVLFLRFLKSHTFNPSPTTLAQTIYVTKVAQPQTQIAYV